MKNKIIIHTDGGARGNPGPAAIGVVIEGLKNGKEIIGRYLGETTNNEAEYRALIAALTRLKEISAQEKFEAVDCFADSKLMVEQLNGRYKIKNTNIRGFFLEIQNLKLALNVPVTFQYVPRAKNAEADKIVNKTLDAASQNQS